MIAKFKHLMQYILASQHLKYFSVNYEITSVRYLYLFAHISSSNSPFYKKGLGYFVIKLFKSVIMSTSVYLFYLHLQHYTII